MLHVSALFTLLLMVALGAFVAARAWRSRPAKVFVVFVALNAVLTLSSSYREQAQSPEAAYWWLLLGVAALPPLIATLLALFAALFAPELWDDDGDRVAPIWWMLIPYIAIGLTLTLDIVAGAGMIVGPIAYLPEQDLYRFPPQPPGSTIVLGLALVGVGVHLVILGRAFMRSARSRFLIILMALALLAGAGLGTAARTIPQLGQVSGIIESSLLSLIFAYAILRQRMFEPERVALDRALAVMSDAVVVFDAKQHVIYANPQAQALGFATGLPADDAFVRIGAPREDSARFADHRASQETETLRRTLAIGSPTQLLETEQTLFSNADGELQGALLLLRDITELERRTALLEQERKRLEAVAARLREERAQRNELEAAVRTLAMPLIPILDGVLVMPLVGDFDAARIAQFSDTLLHGIENAQARHVLLDLTGLDMLDETLASGLLRTVNAAGLLGARCTLVGIRPELAETLVALALPLDHFATAATLQAALRPHLTAAAVRFAA